jgi:DNA-binding HxlR family transcriptional regulator
MSEQPLREPAFLVLTALASGPLHGYALVEDVLRLSDGQVRLHTGTLYAMLDRLREAGLIVVDREEVVESRLRRYYALTDAGIARLLVPAFVTTVLACWGFRGFRPTGIPLGPLVLTSWQALVLVPVIGVIAGFTGLRVYERLLRRRDPVCTRSGDLGA